MMGGTVGMRGFLRFSHVVILLVLIGGLVVGGVYWFGASMKAPKEITEPVLNPMAPELEPSLGWLNTDRPLLLGGDLKGHVVLLDFWTLGCINCIHVLPDLEYLEEKYSDQPFVVIGVHSAKFTNEADRESIRNAVHRYGIRHPVVIDDGSQIWNQYGIRSWPGFVLIGSDGRVIGSAGGEGQRKLLDNSIERALERGQERGDLAAERVQYDPDSWVEPATGLTFPGKVLASSALDRVFIADSSGNRVIVATFPDQDGRSSLVQVVGTGEPGFVDGSATEAQLHMPQGMSLDLPRNVLYIADTENHAVRALDLSTFDLKTIAGTGEQGYDRIGGTPATQQKLSSPWAVAISPAGDELYIAMAGTHQIWSIKMKNQFARAVAGSGYENVLDGPFREAALAQPSGLSFSSDGSKLYFADSESSSIRAMDFESRRVETVIGHTVENLQENGLFEFGDVDGEYPQARLQHPLGVAVMPTEDGDRLLVADTYNHKIREIDPEARRVWTLAGGRRAGPGELSLDEPGGIFFDAPTGLAFVADTNNNRVVVFDPQSGAFHELKIDGLGSAGALVVQADGAVETPLSLDPESDTELKLNVVLPAGGHPNPEAPMTVRVSSLDSGKVLSQRTMRTDSLPVSVTIPAGSVRAGERVLVELSFAWCESGDFGVCRPANVSWAGQVEPGDGTEVELHASAE